MESVAQGITPYQVGGGKGSLKDAFKVRRIFRRLAAIRSSSSLCGLTVFIRYENVVKLLDFLGYCLE